MKFTNVLSAILISLGSTPISAKWFGHRQHNLARVTITKNAIFGISRGGGLFGGGDKPKDDETKIPEGKMYPPLTQEEIEDCLAHIPVFAVTDSNGAGLVLKPDNETSVFYFFLSPQMANDTLTSLQSEMTEGMDLRVSAFSLGKIAFKILDASGQGVDMKLKKPNSDQVETESSVEYRLVPDTRDLLGARMLLTMDAKDGEALKAGDVEAAQAAVKKAIAEAPRFNSTFNEVPVFMIQQMRMQKQTQDGGEQEVMMPMYLNLQNMITTWQQFTSQSAEAKAVEPAIHLLDLYEMIEKMGEESEIDWRNVLLVPSAPGGPVSEGGAPAAVDDEIKMPGASLGDL